MSFSRAFVFALVAALVAPQAFAQDDLFVPLPQEGKTKPKGGKKRTSSKKPTAKKGEPAPSDDELFVPIPSKKPATAKNPEPTLPPSDDDLFVPIGPSKTELAVKLNGSVKGARLFVDSKDMGVLPLTAPLQVDAGDHTVVVRRPGFSEFTRRITVQGGKPSEVAVTLEAVAGVVTVTSDVAGATVAINGQTRGQAPLGNLVLKPGSYEIAVSKDGFQPETKSLAVKAGKDYTVAVSLRPAEKPTVVASTDRPEKPVLTPSDPTVDSNPSVPITPDEPEVTTSSPWFKRWYVWAGVGVVAAAAAGAVVASQSGGSNPLTPGAVCGGTCDGTINGAVRVGGR
jgi:PEGA domain